MPVTDWSITRVALRGLVQRLSAETATDMLPRHMRASRVEGGCCSFVRPPPRILSLFGVLVMTPSATFIAPAVCLSVIFLMITIAMCAFGTAIFSPCGTSACESWLLGPRSSELALSSRWPAPRASFISFFAPSFFLFCACFELAFSPVGPIKSQHRPQHRR